MQINGFDLPSSPDFHEHAQCGKDVAAGLIEADEFTPEGTKISPEALATCRRCAVRVECLAFAVNNPDHAGWVFGGRLFKHKGAVKRHLRELVHLVETKTPGGSHR